MIALAPTPTSPLPLIDRPRRPFADLLISTGLCAVVVFTFACLSEACQHWFILPVFVCGVLIGIDAVAWARGEIDVFGGLDRWFGCGGFGSSFHRPVGHFRGGFGNRLGKLGWGAGDGLARGRFGFGRESRT